MPTLLHLPTDPAPTVLDVAHHIHLDIPKEFEFVLDAFVPHTLHPVVCYIHHNDGHLNLSCIEN